MTFYLVPYLMPLTSGLAQELSRGGLNAGNCVGRITVATVASVAVGAASSSSSTAVSKVGGRGREEEESSLAAESAPTSPPLSSPAETSTRRCSF